MKRGGRRRERESGKADHAPGIAARVTAWGEAPHYFDGAVPFTGEPPVAIAIGDVTGGIVRGPCNDRNLMSRISPEPRELIEAGPPASAGSQVMLMENEDLHGTTIPSIPRSKISSVSPTFATDQRRPITETLGTPGASTDTNVAGITVRALTASEGAACFSR